VLVGLMLGFYFQFAQGNPGDIDAGDLGLSNFIPDDGSPLVKAGVIAVALAVGLVLLRLLGIGWYILRFFGYELRQDGSSQTHSVHQRASRFDHALDETCSGEDRNRWRSGRQQRERNDDRFPTLVYSGAARVIGRGDDR